MEDVDGSYCYVSDGIGHPSPRRHRSGPKSEEALFTVDLSTEETGRLRENQVFYFR